MARASIKTGCIVLLCQGFWPTFLHPFGYTLNSFLLMIGTSFTNENTIREFGFNIWPKSSISLHTGWCLKTRIWLSDPIW